MKKIILNKKIEIYLHIVIILAVGCIVYLNTLDSNWYLDDFSNIVNNTRIRTLDYSFRELFQSRGIVNLSFSFNYYLNNLDVGGYHLFNILLHLSTSLVVYLILKRVFVGQAWWALCAVLVFLVHPLQTQTVTYVVQRMAGMAGFFFFLSLYLYIVAREKMSRLESSWFFWLSALISGALAVMCKENAATLPVLLFLFDVFYLSDFKIPRTKRLFMLLPFFVVPLLFAVIRIGVPVIAGSSFQQLGTFETTNALESVTPLKYFSTEIPVYWIYIRLLIFPFGQALDYGYPFVDKILNLKSFFSLCGFFLLFVFVWVNKKKAPWLLFGVLWFFLSLSVESTFIPLEPIYEHRLYVPMFGFAVVVTFLLKLLAIFFRDYSMLFVIGYLFFLGVLAYSRNEIWRDPVLFWESNARQVVSGSRPIMQLADAYFQRGKMDLANITYKRAIQMAEAAGRSSELGAGYLVNMCVASERLAEFDSAVYYCRLAISKSPNYPSAHYNLGVVQYRQGDLVGSLKSFDRARRLSPPIPAAYYNYASVALEIGDIAPAEEIYTQLMLLDSSLALNLSQEMAAFREKRRLH